MGGPEAQVPLGSIVGQHLKRQNVEGAGTVAGEKVLVQTHYEKEEKDRDRDRMAFWLKSQVTSGPGVLLYTPGPWF